MYWRFGGYANISWVDSLLDKPDLTLEELLDESDLIQELKQNNSKLIEYLREDNVLERLVQYVIGEKPPDTRRSKRSSERSSRSGEAVSGIFGRSKAKSRERTKSAGSRERQEEDEARYEKQRLRHAHLACEILSLGVWSITEALLDNSRLLRLLWSYMDKPAPLDALQAGYFTKVNESMLDKKTEEMLDFIKTVDGVVLAMLQHVDCPMIMDLLLKIISLEKTEGGRGVTDWLQTSGLIPVLLSYISSDHPPATQTSAGDFLKAIITISANATTQDESVIGPNELTRQLVSEECITKLIEEMLRGGNPLTVGVGIVIEVIRKNNSDYDVENQVGPEPKTSDPIYLGTLLRQFANHVPDFMTLILDPNHAVLHNDGTYTRRKLELKVAFGEKIEPLGFDRFKTCELMAELLHCSNMALLNERGAEAEVKQRDVERQKMKGEGRFLIQKASPDNALFGSSVDSSGFHHATFDEPIGGSPQEIKKLEVQNSGEDEEFEKVILSEANHDRPSGKSQDTNVEQNHQSFSETGQHGDPEKVELSFSKDTSSTATLGQSRSAITDEMIATHPASDTEAIAHSPTGLSDKVGGLGLQEDTNMQSPPTSPPSRAQGMDISHSTCRTSSTMRSLLRMRPVSSERIEAASSYSQQSSPGPARAPETFEETPNLSNAFESTYLIEPDIDGTPIVGDLLKIMFVENRVVPTILVS